MNINTKYTANQDIRDYMADNGVTQKALAQQMGLNISKVNKMLKYELSEVGKENFLRHIDAIAGNAMGDFQEEDSVDASEGQQVEETEDVFCGAKFQVGDRVKIPSKQLSTGIVSDIWHSMVQNMRMYAVDLEGGHRGLYEEGQLEPAPLPTTYSWESHIDGNVAVCIMYATQGEKTWVCARGHAHIIHDGEVGMAQAISYAARRMFEFLDSKQENKIYLK